MIEYLRRTKIWIPKCVKEMFPENETLRIGFDSCNKTICLYLIPKYGHGKLELVASLKANPDLDYLGAKEAKNYIFCEELKKLAKDEGKLEKLLTSYVENGRKPVVDQYGKDLDELIYKDGRTSKHC